jgi:hypothetical protein
MIKSILLATGLAFSATAASASTVKLPKEFLGPWCFSESYPDPQPYAMIYKRGRCDDPAGDGNHIVRMNGYDYHEGGCKTIKSVKRSSARGSSAYVMTYRCNGEGDKWTEKKTLLLDEMDRLWLFND